MFGSGRVGPLQSPLIMLSKWARLRTQPLLRFEIENSVGRVLVGSPWSMSLPDNVEIRYPIIAVEHQKEEI